jgi:hypothetical protein
VAAGLAKGDVVVVLGIPNRKNITAATTMMAAIKIGIKIGIMGCERMGFLSFRFTPRWWCRP